MAQLLPYLHFNGKCREAMEFYKSVLGGELNFMKIGGTPMAEGMPPEMHEQIMHSELVVGGKTLLFASDMAQEGAPQGKGQDLCLVCESRDEIETLFKKLAEGGTVENPLGDMFFGTYGDLTDKYGYKWLLHFDSTVR